MGSHLDQSQRRIHVFVLYPNSIVEDAMESDHVLLSILRLHLRHYCFGFQMTECQPIRFFWDPTVPGGYCRDPHLVRTGIIATSVIFAISDLQFPLLPMTFIHPQLYHEGENRSC